MKHVIRGLIAMLVLGVAVPAQAAIKILATTADWGALATELGGDRVNVYTATGALQDVHRVDAKPSLVARARTADLLLSNGSELEIGWLPVLVRESGNKRIQPGGPGYFEATAEVRLLEKPSRLDRAMGDIHPQGNPHIQLDPRNIAAVAKALTTRLAEIDAANAAYYQQRGADFNARWSQAMARWETRAAPLKGVPVVVMHRDQDAGDQCRPQDAEVGRVEVHWGTASSRFRVSSKSPNRSFAPGVPPTENGSSTTGAPTRFESQSAGFGSL